MNIYQKLQKCRVDLQNKKLTKSGFNKFSNYDYFELSDFLPEINRMFNDIGLCSMVVFSSEAAELMIIDSDKPDDLITFCSPMSTAHLTACHEVQNLGAVETYLRRYLYMTALEIVEGDILDKTHDKNAKDKDEVKRDPLCEACGNKILPTQHKTVEEIVAGSKKIFDKQLCAACSIKMTKENK